MSSSIRNSYSVSQKHSSSHSSEVNDIDSILDTAIRKFSHIRIDRTAHIAEPAEGVDLDEIQNLLPYHSSRIHIAFQSGVPEYELNAMVKLRKFLSLDTVQENVKKVLDLKILPKMMEFLQKGNADLQYETGWVLTNICAGTSKETEAVVSAGAIPILIGLLRSDCFDVRVQSAWCLGNIAGDSPRLRDAVIDQGIIRTLLHLYNTEYSDVDRIQQSDVMPFVRISVWTIANLCRGYRPQPNWRIIMPIFPLLCRLLRMEDQETLTDICWGISRIMHGEHDNLHELVSSELCERLITLVNYPHDSRSLSLCVPALRAITNIVSGDDSTTSILLSVPHCLSRLVELLPHEYIGIKKEVILTFSNIAAGNIDQVRTVAHCGMIPPLLDWLKDPHQDYRMKREIIWCFSNLSSLHDADVAAGLVECGLIEILCNLLHFHADDHIILLKALDVFTNLITSGNLYVKSSKDRIPNPVMPYFPLDFMETLQVLTYNNKSAEVKERCDNLKFAWMQGVNYGVGKFEDENSEDQEMEAIDSQMKGLSIIHQ
ncbi:armadillo-type protein [Paraphysoderma sedebokerense]|nr:armadillo-type protein [Paraphysoderma sedebokerense]